MEDPLDVPLHHGRVEGLTVVEGDALAQPELEDAVVHPPPALGQPGL